MPARKMLPPAHPRCACAVEYIEVEPPVFQPENITEIETEVDAEEQKEFSSGEEAEEYFGKRPDRSLRRSDPGKSMIGNWTISKPNHRMESGASRPHRRKRHRSQTTAGQITAQSTVC